jgi:hypothetical protein
MANAQVQTKVLTKKCHDGVGPQTRGAPWDFPPRYMTSPPLIVAINN